MNTIYCIAYIDYQNIHIAIICELNVKKNINLSNHFVLHLLHNLTYLSTLRWMRQQYDHWKLSDANAIYPENLYKIPIYP